MRKTILCATALTVLAGSLAAFPAAQAQPAAKPMDDMHHSAAAMEESGATMMRKMVGYQIGEAQKKLIQLAEKMPADKFGWRPAPGVRSVGEVFMHVASANYFFPTTWGGAPATGVDPRTLEKDGGDKAKTVAALKASFDYVAKAMAALPDAELHKSIDVFGHKATPADMFLVVATHAHEHLGQSIAYARMSGVTPPWSEEQEKQMKKETH